jgi:glycosyltransferase involved in cell wall biosynthesis
VGTERKIRILFAPSNIASVPDVMIQAFNKRPGIEAHGFSLGTHRYWTFNDNWTIIENVPRKFFFKKVRSYLQRHYQLLRLILWADVIFWTWDIKDITFFDIHYRLLKRLQKVFFVEWVGSDIRVPEIGFSLNPFYKQCWESGEYDYYEESLEKSIAIQKRFVPLNATPLEGPEMCNYLNRDLFPEYYPLHQPRIDINAFIAEYPDAQNKIPVVVHAPSARGAKGSKFVKKAIEKLQQKNLPFRYVEISNKTRKESLDAIREADIFIDQLIWGNYGVAGAEAMAMGKPMICYLMPKVVEQLPVDCPVINATCDNLAEVLETYLLDGVLRNTSGKACRKFVEAEHDANKLVIGLENEIRKKIATRQ